MEKNKRYLVVFGIFALVIVTTAASYAFFTYSRVGNTTTTITSGDIEFTYKEGEDASLANAFPVADSVGANDTTEEYTFTVNLKSTSSLNKINYNVYLLDNNDEENVNYFNNEQIKFALIKDGTFVAGTSSTLGRKLSNVPGFDTGKSKGEGLVLENQEITSGKTDEYKLRIWVSGDVNYSNTTGNDSQVSVGKYNSYKYSLKVKVTTSYITSSSTNMNNFEIENKTINVELNDPNGLDSYAITESIIAPNSDSTEWIDISNQTTQNNTLKISNTMITTATITYTVDDNGTYYLHIKNKLNQIATKSFIVGEEKYSDVSGANNPELATGMIPILWNGNWVKADLTKEWYNYDNQEWANAVTVSDETKEKYNNATPGTVIDMDDITTMWVWIPRYEYETITSDTATEIKVNFLTGTESNKTDNYITHPGFDFGDESLTGIWFAKFEASSDIKCNVEPGSINTDCDITTPNVIVKPNVTSWRGIRVSTFVYNVEKMSGSKNIYGFVETEVETHAMKNSEWGAVAYLSQSKYGKYGNSKYDGANKEIFYNDSRDYITGMSSGKPGGISSNIRTSYNGEYSGLGASTTGNIYGVYDMSGGSWEYVMAVLNDPTNEAPMSGRTEKYNSGYKGKIYNAGEFTYIDGKDFLEKKYYDSYSYPGNTYMLGDAIEETRKWYDDAQYFIYKQYPWLVRGGDFRIENNQGVFSCFSIDGGSIINATFRPVLTKK